MAASPLLSLGFSMKYAEPKPFYSICVINGVKFVLVHTPHQASGCELEFPGAQVIFLASVQMPKGVVIRGETIVVMAPLLTQAKGVQIYAKKKLILLGSEWSTEEKKCLSLPIIQRRQQFILEGFQLGIRLKSPQVLFCAILHVADAIQTPLLRCCIRDDGEKHYEIMEREGDGMMDISQALEFYQTD